jgi:transposase
VAPVAPRKPAERVAVTGDDDVTSNKIVREMEARIRELERQLGRSSRGQDLIRGIKSLEEHSRSRSSRRPSRNPG